MTTFTKITLLVALIYPSLAESDVHFFKLYPQPDTTCSGIYKQVQDLHERIPIVVLKKVIQNYTPAFNALYSSLFCPFMNQTTFNQRMQTIIAGINQNLSTADQAAYIYDQLVAYALQNLQYYSVPSCNSNYDNDCEYKDQYKTCFYNAMYWCVGYKYSYSTICSTFDSVLTRYKQLKLMPICRDSENGSSGSNEGNNDCCYWNYNCWSQWSNIIGWQWVYVTFCPSALDCLDSLPNMSTNDAKKSQNKCQFFANAGITLYESIMQKLSPLSAYLTTQFQTTLNTNIANLLAQYQNYNSFTISQTQFNQLYYNSVSSLFAGIRSDMITSTAALIDQWQQVLYTNSALIKNKNSFLLGLTNQDQTLDDWHVEALGYTWQNYFTLIDSKLSAVRSDFNYMKFFYKMLLRALPSDSVIAAVCTKTSQPHQAFINSTYFSQITTPIKPKTFYSSRWVKEPGRRVGPFNILSA